MIIKLITKIRLDYKDLRSHHACIRARTRFDIDRLGDSSRIKEGNLVYGSEERYIRCCNLNYLKNGKKKDVAI